jgi:hypothetical protein
VKIPCEEHAPVVVEIGHAGDSGDALPSILAPRFQSGSSLDQETVSRETAARIKNMMVGGCGSGEELRAPSAKAIEDLVESQGGACEAYPLSKASDANGHQAVRLYIDEVGALRSLPRNPRAEALALAVGMSGLSIHGDAYVGRCVAGSGGEGGAPQERSINFSKEELAHDSPWVREARQWVMAASAAAVGSTDDDALASGGDGEGGLYTWSQGDEDVEVRVLRGIPEGKGGALKKRIKVSYGKGEALRVQVDGEPLLAIEKLFDRVTPDECSWSVDGAGTLVISMEKSDARAWSDLTLPGYTVHGPTAPPVDLVQPDGGLTL